MCTNPQEYSGEVEKVRANFEALLSSCDLFDTPFDATKFEADISALQERLNHCDKVSTHIINNMFAPKACYVHTYMYMYVCGSVVFSIVV